MKSKTKILIVDDELINLDFFAVMFSKLGFEVEKAEDGEEALEKVKQFVPDLIILDNIMPKLSGWEVTKTLKQDEAYSDVRHIPVIMFSAMDDVKDKIEGFELGVEDYITKPFNFSEVLVRIKAVLRHKDLADQIARRERRLALYEALNTSVAEYIRKVKKSLKDVLKEAKKPETGGAQAVGAFIGRLTVQAESSLEDMENAEKELHEAGIRDKALKEGEVSLKELEEKYLMHLDGDQG
ncbi:MAG: response regulator [Spirochaetales bacterium]|jgi:DNA-binding response OmpR family regulator|nr:response regulator [Spirochaetales bacterium]